MEEISEEARDAYLTSYQREALHFEARDIYATDIEHGRYAEWLRGEPLAPAEGVNWWPWWRDLMAANLAAGKTLRRLRVVSVPVSDYIRFELIDTDLLVKSGEDVRWLSRAETSRLLLPGNDFWLFDGETIVFTYFSGDGRVLRHERSTDPELIHQCLAAFEAAWARATPHQQFKPA